MRSSQSVRVQTDVVEGLLVVLGGGGALVVVLVAEVEEEPGGGGGALPLVVEPMSPHLMLEKVAYMYCQSRVRVMEVSQYLRPCTGCFG